MRKHKPKAQPYYRFTLTITIKGRVPFDMMRYDNAVPASQEDAANLDRIARGSASHFAVRFVCFMPHADGPAVERWQSFGHHVHSVESIPV